MTLAENIRRIREEKKMTQKSVASLMGISQQAYGQYESGSREPKPETLGRIAAALGTTLNEITKETDSVPDDDGAMKNYIKSFVWGQGTQLMTQWDAFFKILHEIPHASELWCAFDKLNDAGRSIAVERVEELSLIPKYQRPAEPTQDAPNAPDDKEPAEK